MQDLPTASSLRLPPKSCLLSDLLLDLLGGAQPHSLPLELLLGLLSLVWGAAGIILELVLFTIREGIL